MSVESPGDVEEARRERRADRRPTSDERRADRRPFLDDVHDEHPTRLAPLAELIGRTRFVVLLAVASVLLVSVALFVIGAGLAVKGTISAAASLIQGDMAATSITVDLLEVVSVMLKAVVFYLIGVGFYSLFIAPLNLVAALGIRSFADLEVKIVSVVVVIMAVTFLEHYIRWEQPVETLLYGFSLAVVVAALVAFQMYSHRSSREDEVEDARVRTRAQRRMFHQDEEEREVRPDDGPAPREPEPAKDGS